MDVAWLSFCFIQFRKRSESSEDLCFFIPKDDSYFRKFYFSNIVFTCDSTQGRRENSRGPGQNFIWGSYDVIILRQKRLKTGGKYCRE